MNDTMGRQWRRDADYYEDDDDDDDDDDVDDHNL